jgi:hypothetical protein
MSKASEPSCKSSLKGKFLEGIEGELGKEHSTGIWAEPCPEYTFCRAWVKVLFCWLREPAELGKPADRRK